MNRRERRPLATITFAAAIAIVTFACSPKRPELVRRPEHPASALAIRNVAVLDVETGTLTPGRDVFVQDGSIVAVTAAGEGSAPPNAAEIDGAGATLLPGLIDAHGHVGNSSEPGWLGKLPDPDANLRAYLYCGVTTVLDPADLSSQAFDRRDRVARGELLGPRIFAAGPMVTAPGGHPIPILRQLAPWWIRWYLRPRIAIEISSPDEAREAADRIAEMGADFMKLAVDHIPEEAPEISNEVLVAAVAEARKKGLRPIAHIGSTDDALAAARAGVAAWMHGVYKERIADEKIAELAAFHIPMVPTMVVFDSYAGVGRGPREPTPLERETVPDDVLRAFDPVPESYDMSFFRTFLDRLYAEREHWRENVRRLRAAGVTMFAGSDTQTGVFPGAGLHRELALLTEAGLTPADAIRAATIDPARFLANGKEPEFGIVAPGKRADLLLVEGDPTRDLGVLARIRAVIRDGVVLERTAVDGSRKNPAMPHQR
ncbi:MAG: hypothetical protein QOD06_2717 [Candidatus Binatota bacterium]|nr:hypothetical protein [Candidatus Binatota bacterium]